MASTALNVFSGIAAAAAGLAGEKVAKDGSIPGLDLATILPALLGSKAGGTGSNLLGSLASTAVKSGLLNSANIGKIAELAGSLLTISASKKAADTKAKDTKAAATTKTTKASTAVATIASLASAIAGSTGTASNLGTIATLASKLAGTAKTEPEKTSMASELGKTLSSAFGISLNGTGKAVTAMEKALPSDTKSALFSSILKGLIS